MKAHLRKHSVATVAIFLIWVSASAQGTFIYDQQSSTEANLGEAAVVIQSSQPIGQSFTPTLSSVGFIRLYLIDATVNGIGATVFLNLRTDSITGPILGFTDSVTMSDSFSGTADFSFSTPVQVTPGTAYYFQPVVQSGDTWRVAAHNGFNYTGGTAFYFGQPAPSSDLWFREGIVIPEPSVISLFLVGVGVLLYAPLARHFRTRACD